MSIFFLTLSAFDAAVGVMCFRQGLNTNGYIFIAASAFCGFTAWYHENIKGKE